MSTPHPAIDVEEKEESFLHYVWLRRAKVELMMLPKKVHTFLVTPQIPKCIPLLVEIMPKFTKLSFEDVDTRQ